MTIGPSQLTVSVSLSQLSVNTSLSQLSCSALLADVLVMLVMYLVTECLTVSAQQ